MSNPDGVKSVRGYQLKDELGRGGIGIVYRAHQEVVERDVAIKVIRPKYANEPDFIRRFQIEAQMVARLEHPHIIPLYDYWREPQGAYLVMRWIREGSLRDLLDRNQNWQIDQIAILVRQISSALTVAHQNNVIHRDIKPENILIDGTDNAYLTDFGIAIDLQNNELFEENISYGSPQYSAPEQFSEKIVTPQSDVYSMGILLFELLTGTVPFSGVDTGELLRQQQYMPLPSVRQFVPELPARLDEIIWKATNKQWNKRYQTIAEFAREFETAVKYITAKPGSPQRQQVITDTIQLDNQADAVARSGTAQLFTQPLGAAQRAAPPARNPYKGLQPFSEADASDFFGRDQDINRLVEKLKSIQLENTARFVALVGASGSGKSSLVRAGLIPALRNGAVYGSEKWFITTMTPGKVPLLELQLALSRVATQEADNTANVLEQPEGLIHAVNQLLPASATLLLFIDQFEELFALIEDDAQRVQFLNLIQDAVTNTDRQIYIVITLRADFYDRPLVYPFFAELLHRSTELILPLSPEQLEDAITEPAYRADLDLEPALSTYIVNDLQAQSSSLPLLQYTLSQLYDLRENNTLTRASYIELGGVGGALAKRAQTLYDALTENEKQITQQLFLRLVTLNEQSQPTRQRIVYNEILSLFQDERHQAERVIEQFSQYRLLTRDRDAQTRLPTVEVAHETLLNSWQQLATWISDSQDALRLQRQLTTAVREWENAEHEPSYLAAGTRLAAFEQLQSNSMLTLTQTETEYLGKSIRRRQQLRRRNQLAISALIIITVLSVLFGALAYLQQQAAVAQRNRADVAAARARSGELAAIAQSNLPQTDLALLLGIAAFNETDTFEARNSILTAVQRNPFITRYYSAHEGGVRSVAFAPDGEWFISAGADRTLRRWDAATGEMMGQPLEGHTANVNAIAVSADSQLIASGSSDGTVRLWNSAGNEVTETPFEHEVAVWSVAFSPNATTLATGDENGQLYLWDVENSEASPAPIEAHEGTVFTVAFSPDGSRLLTGGEDNLLRLWDAETGEQIAELDGHSGWVLKTRYSPDGSFIASTGVDTTVRLWNAESGEFIGQFPTGHTNWVRGLAFDETGNFLATASYDGTARVFSVASGQPATTPITGHTDALWDVAFAPNELEIITGGRDGKLVAYDLTRPQPILESILPTETDLLSIAVSSDNEFAIGGGGATADAPTGGQIQLIDLNSGEILSTLQDHQGAIVELALSADGTTLASSSLDQTVNIWDVETGTLQVTLADENAGVMNGVTFSVDGTAVYTTDESNRILIWNAADGILVDRIDLHSGEEAHSLALSLDGQFLAAGHRDGNVSLWTTADTSHLVTFEGHTDVVTDLAFAADNTLLISTSRDGTVRVWDIAVREPVGTPLPNHQDWVMSVSVQPDGAMFATTGRDGTAILWDIATQQPIGLPLQAHNGMVAASTFTAEGSKLLTAGADGNIIIWQSHADGWKQTACEIANRQFTSAEWQRFFDIPYQDIC